MPLTNGTRLGPYEILAPIGAGGMGEVYRAKDIKLDREVAIKVLPEALAKDPDRLARFEREAKILAALNHPNIAQIYGLEENALVMELVVGTTLSVPQPLDTALNYGRQIAEALEVAHEKGITHRDLKPGNIMVTPEGVVKVLDFGLASVPGREGVIDQTNSPTMTFAAATQAGMIMGTAGYMSPEQAAGKVVDRRSDIWSFGVVLYEMLTGTRLFDGETLSHTLADVLRAPIDFLNVKAPTPIVELLKRCLDRDLKTRLRDIGEARIAIAKYVANPKVNGPAEARPTKLPWVVAAVLALAALAFGFLAFRPSQIPDPQAVRLSFQLPQSARLPGYSVLSISPDGRHIVYRAAIGSSTALWLRDLDSADSQLIPGTDTHMTGSFAAPSWWSPDSRSIAFFVSGKIMKMAVTGGPLQRVCDVPLVLGGSWGRDDIMLVAVGGGGLMSVPAGGGKLTPVTELDKSRREDVHQYPWFLPDGRHFLYTNRTPDRTKNGIFLGDLSSKQGRLLVDAPSNAEFVEMDHSSRGFLLYVRDQTLMAQPFDAGKLQMTSSAVPVVERVSYGANVTGGSFSASQNGTLLYTSGGLVDFSQLSWFDRAGKKLGTVGEKGVLEMTSLSPDEQTVVADRADLRTGNFDLWLHDLRRHTDTRFTFTGSSRFPVWSPDGTHVAFDGARNGVRSMYQKSTNGGAEEILTASNLLPMHWSRDGRYIIAMTVSQTATTGNDLWGLPLFGDRKVFPIAQTEFQEHSGKLSPDGRWLAYSSNESGQQDVYVVSFPTPGSKWRISSNGGDFAVWSQDGRKLYFLSGDDRMMEVDITPGEKFQAGLPRPLFGVQMARQNTRFSVTKDGRFLIPELVDQEAIPVQVILNWTALLKGKP